MADAMSVKADDLRYLAAVVSTGRLTQAARALGVDHSTVSRRLRALEQALGTRLLQRIDEGWELTEAGRSVIEQARAVERAVGSAVRAVGVSDPEVLTGAVRITAADGFGALVVTPAMAYVRRQHPALRIELVTGARELTLRDTSFDIAVTPGAPPPATRLFTERLCEYDNEFYASHEYLERHGNPQSLDELAEHPIISFVESVEKIREIDLSRIAPRATVRFSSNNIFAQLEAIRRGMGIGLLGKFVASSAPELQPIAAYIPPARVLVTLAVRRDALRRPEIQVVREALHREVRLRRSDLV
ncbi:LysR family transcriptional regulator [Actinoplanes sp. N902-109]|uniref:LysR family transcriptional regulator n=1 Tax=Actinoplanes sp. (strain N902-109) TaxID=649831 RepID=UPI00032955D1|nr:LysR family transcriptional regulator [Actinoplanes sp. N902-109]AGL16307.1 LysR family transcriptional regulator [Actinoplanes sp. N902-109]